MEQNNKNSIGMQVEKIVISPSFTLAEVELICKGIFYDNFIKIQDEVKQIVDSRIQEFSEKLFEKLEKINLFDMDKFKTTDIQYNLYQAQNAYVRTENEEKRDIIIEIIASRINSEEESNLQLNYNQAIELLPKINKKHIDILTFLFFINEVGVTYLENVQMPKDKDQLIRYLDTLMQFINFEITGNDLRYLSSCGCGTFNLPNLLEERLIRNSATMFEFKEQKGLKKIGEVPNIIINGKEMSIREYIISLDTKYKILFEKYNESKLCEFRMSSIAALIGLKNLEIKINDKLDAYQWFG